MSECGWGLVGRRFGSWSLRASPAGLPLPPFFPSSLPDARESRIRRERNTNHVVFISFHFYFSLLTKVYVASNYDS